jgi:hypothetical protein
VDEQAVVVNVPLHGARGDFAYLQDLGERLAERVDSAGVGVFDGDLIGLDQGVLYLYGPDADRLWEAVEDLVREASLPAGSYVLKRHGGPGELEMRIDLDAPPGHGVTRVDRPARQRYHEGDWFAAPLEDGTFVLGRIARHHRGTILGYFFAPPFDRVPTLDETAGRQAGDSFTQLLFSHLGLRDGEWPVLGQAGTWDRAAWPLLEFERRIDWPGQEDRLYVVRRDEENLNQTVDELRVDLSETGKRPSDSLHGSKAVLVHLQQELAERRSR